MMKLLNILCWNFMQPMDPYIDNMALRSHRPGLKKLLGDQEAEIMEQVWALGGPVLARQIHERMPSGERLAYSTVVCTMGRLVTKRLLRVIDDTTKPYRYLPTISQQDFINQAVERVICALIEDFPGAVSAVVEREGLHTPGLVEAVLDLKE
ncbi:BlaI/MecI/CopY family transcriptional regulator [Candidatus Cyanaurora vandensis]|uniref:BlaI/MecI/CopY family transcriptional regulator n=1 Tax=Candidatus Cyanaurora vandensis TaxID=2714958 RepID=UPI00257BED0C|nr:BlaI/MecI/CopY family transcriptional regulator [Candidatus Cyanaurora vandensis]